MQIILQYSRKIWSTESLLYVSLKIHRKRKGILIQKVYFRHSPEKKEIAKVFLGQKFKKKLKE